MSSTRRNLLGSYRHADDFYATPPEVTRLILPHVTLGANPLDPCAGDGAILRELGGHAWGIEIDTARAASCRAGGFLVHEADALEMATRETWGRPSAVITNPPFSLAMDFVGVALMECEGEVVMLLRLAFLESKTRAAFHREHPADVFVLSERPSFVEHLRWKVARCEHLTVTVKRCELEAGHEGDHRQLGTDSTAYAWFRWPESNKRKNYEARIRVL